MQSVAHYASSFTLEFFFFYKLVTLSFSIFFESKFDFLFLIASQVKNLNQSVFEVGFTSFFETFAIRTCSSRSPFYFFLVSIPFLESIP